MNDHDPKAAEALRPLLIGLVEGTLTAMQAVELDTLLRHDPEARRRYVRFITVDALLHWQHAPMPIPAGRPIAKPSVAVGSRRFVWRSVAAVGALAAAVALMVALNFATQPRPIDPTQTFIANPSAIAMLSDLSDDAQFTDEMANLALGADLQAGRLKLARGSAQLMFRGGAVVDLMGPCDFEMTGPGRGRLTRGQLSTYVPPEARGFTISGPNGVEVIDLGTRFVMRADSTGAMRVDVVEGRVAIAVDGKVRDLLTLGQSWSMFSTAEGMLVSAGRVVSVGLNFGADQQAIGEDESAGHPWVAQSHWNNLLGPAGTQTNLTDQSGANTGMTVTWSGAAKTFALPGAATTGSDKVMKGYLDSSDRSTTTIRVSNIPLGDYDVYVYFDGDNGPSWRVAQFTIDDTTFEGEDSENRDYLTTAKALQMALPGAGDSNKPYEERFDYRNTSGNNGEGNFVVFAHRSGDQFVLTAVPGRSNSTPRAPINAIQIVGHLAGDSHPVDSTTRVSGIEIPADARTN
ncbi:MAG: hypothetical protein GC162_19220 [Planctomycetes bacterium]|nr:hypothetical protein [Planctomycetota bacterium]